MDQLPEFFCSDHDGDILDVDLQMIQYWIVVDTSSNFYTVPIVLFHKYGGVNVSVKNCVSHFYMIVPTKANAKLAHWNTVHDQRIEIFYVILITAPLYNQWDQFIIVNINL